MILLFLSVDDFFNTIGKAVGMAFSFIGKAIGSVFGGVMEGTGLNRVIGIILVVLIVAFAVWVISKIVDMIQGRRKR